MKSNQSSLWDFSLVLYNDACTQAACLKLQDTYGADVNVILYLLFLGQQGREVLPESVALIDGAISTWRKEVVQPLRQLRRHLKSADFGIAGDTQEAFRSTVKKVELSSEKLEQDRLAALEPDTLDVSDWAAAARTNLERYAVFIGAPVSDSGFITLVNRLTSLAG